MSRRLEKLAIVIPLHLPLGYPCDYIDQTASILGRRNQVIFFDLCLPYSWKELFVARKMKIFLDSVVRIMSSKPGQVYFRPTAALPFQSNDIVYKLNRALGIIELNILLFFSRKKTLVWGFHPITSLLLGLFGKKKYIYDCIDLVDRDRLLQGYLGDEKKLLKKADCIVFISSALALLKIRENPWIKDKTLITVCGCNTGLFFKRMRRNKELVRIQKKKLICVGVFDFRCNLALLRHIVKANPDMCFIFIGPVAKKSSVAFRKFFNSFDNVLYLSEKKKHELPAYLQAADLGLIPYKTSLSYVKYGNPMKTYEYLASGIPVVATKIEALKQYPKDIVFTTDNHDEFSQALRRLLVEWNNKKKRVAEKIAEKNSWENKVKKIEDFVVSKILN